MPLGSSRAGITIDNRGITTKAAQEPLLAVCPKKTCRWRFYDKDRKLVISTLSDHFIETHLSAEDRLLALARRAGKKGTYAHHNGRGRGA